MINILGTEYELLENVSVEECKHLEKVGAFTDTSIKKIIIGEYGFDDSTIKNLNSHIRKVKRHEIIHAILFESGLDCNTDWATNEEIIDWIAIQYPKLKKIYEELNIEE